MAFFRLSSHGQHCANPSSHSNYLWLIQELPRDYAMFISGCNPPVWYIVAFFFPTPGTVTQSPDHIKVLALCYSTCSESPSVVDICIGAQQPGKEAVVLFPSCWTHKPWFPGCHIRINQSGLALCSHLLLLLLLPIVQFYASNNISLNKGENPTSKFVFHFAIFHKVQSICAALCSQCPN